MADTPIDLLTELVAWLEARTTRDIPELPYQFEERIRKVIEAASAGAEEPCSVCSRAHCVVCALPIADDTLVHVRMVGETWELRHANPCVAAPSDSSPADTPHVHESCSCGDSPSGDPHCKQCSAPLTADTPKCRTHVYDKCTCGNTLCRCTHLLREHDTGGVCYSCKAWCVTAEPYGEPPTHPAVETPKPRTPLTDEEIAELLVSIGLTRGAPITWIAAALPSTTLEAAQHLLDDAPKLIATIDALQKRIGELEKERDDALALAKHNKYRGTY